MSTYKITGDEPMVLYIRHNPETDEWLVVDQRYVFAPNEQIVERVLDRLPTLSQADRQRFLISMKRLDASLEKTHKALMRSMHKRA